MKTANHNITASWDTLSDQAQQAAETYLRAAQMALDRSGLRHDTTHIIELAALMQREFASAASVVASQNVRDGLLSLGESLQSLPGALHDEFQPYLQGDDA
ncbi:MAG: hypothetical protein RIS35_1854 [Pseudomonadota bacterium]|jgi:predicted XRE-type DNA-binding protein